MNTDERTSPHLDDDDDDDEDAVSEPRVGGGVPTYIFMIMMIMMIMIVMMMMEMMMMVMMKMMMMVKMMIMVMMRIKTMIMMMVIIVVMIMIVINDLSSFLPSNKCCAAIFCLEGGRFEVKFEAMMLLGEMINAGA